MQSFSWEVDDNIQLDLPLIILILKEVEKYYAGIFCGGLHRRCTGWDFALERWKSGKMPGSYIGYFLVSFLTLSIFSLRMYCYSRCFQNPDIAKTGLTPIFHCDIAASFKAHFLLFTFQAHCGIEEDCKFYRFEADPGQDVDCHLFK